MGYEEKFEYLIAKGSIYLTLERSISTVISILGLSFLARVISQEEMGMLAAVTLISSLLTVLSDFGLNASFPKLISEMIGRKEDISTILLTVTIFRIITSILPCGIVLIFSNIISNLLFGTSLHSYFIVLATFNSLLLSILPIFYSVLWGSGKLKRIALCQIFSTVARWLSILLLIVIGYKFYGVIVGWIVGDLILLFLYFISSIKQFKLKNSSFKITILPTVLKFSLPLYLSSIVSFIYTWYDRAIILAFLPLADLGIYDISFKAFNVIASVGIALGSALFPYYGMAYGKKDYDFISNGIKKASKYTMMAMFPLSLGLFSVSRPVITIFAGKNYESGWSILAILSIFGLVYGLSAAISNLLLIYEKTKILFMISFIPVISSLTILPILATYGLDGLAFLRGISLLLTFLISLFFLSKIVKINFDKNIFFKIIFLSSLMAFSVFILQNLYYNELMLPMYVLFGLIFYILGIRFLKILDEKDMNLFQSIFGKKITKYLRKIFF